MGLESRFFIKHVRKTDLLWEAVCTENLLNIMVSLDFMFIEESISGSSGIAFWSHFGRCLVSLGSPLGVLEGIEMSSQICRNFDFHWGPQDLREYAKWMTLQGESRKP